MNYQALLQEAKLASNQAYVPYSNFPVGAAILTETGEVFSGCNVENSSYGLTICAERVAVTKAVSAGFKSFRAIAIYAAIEDPISPCGACRQVLSEFGNEIDVVMGNIQETYIIAKTKELLPGAFNLKTEQG